MSEPQTVTLTMTLTDLQAALVDAMRGMMPREQFLLKALEIGFCDLQDDKNRMTKDGIYRYLDAATAAYQQARERAKFELVMAEGGPSITAQQRHEHRGPIVGHHAPDM